MNQPSSSTPSDDQNKDGLISKYKPVIIDYSDLIKPAIVGHSHVQPQVNRLQTMGRLFRQGYGGNGIGKAALFQSIMYQLSNKQAVMEKMISKIERERRYPITVHTVGAIGHHLDDEYMDRLYTNLMAADVRYLCARCSIDYIVISDKDITRIKHKCPVNKKTLFAIQVLDDTIQVYQSNKKFHF